MKEPSLGFLNIPLFALCMLVAVNGAGLFQARAQGPAIITQPQDQVVSIGASATFGVVASGNPPLAYQWRFDGANLPGQNSNTLHFATVTTNNAGTYTVVISNAGGSVTSSPAALVVIPILPGTLDSSFDAGDINDVVRSVHVPGSDKILVAGWFTFINDTNWNRIARLNGDGSLDTSFNPGSGANNGIYAMAVQTNGQILIGGAFSSVNGSNRPSIARLNSDGSVDPTFNPGFGANAPVWSLAIQPDGKILIGGDFTTVNGTQRRHIARLNNDGSVDNTFIVDVSASVRAMALQTNGQVLIGGMFGSVNSLSFFNLARLNDNGALDLSFIPWPNHWVFSILVQGDGKIVVGGNFNGIGGTNRNRIARLNNDGSVDSTFDPGTGANEGVSALALQPDGKILVGGGFTQFDGRDQFRIARLHLNGRLDELFAPNSGADCWVESIALQNDGKVLIGGCFLMVNDMPRRRVARLIGGDPDPFAPIISGQPTNQAVGEGVNVTFHVQAFAFPAPLYQWQRNSTNLPGATNATLSLRNVRVANAGSYRVVVSNFVGSVTSTVATLTVQPAPTNPGAPDIDFYSGAGPNGQVNAVAVQSDNKVLIGGLFTQVDGVPRVAIARLNQNGSVDASFNPIGGASNLVNAVALQNDKVLIGGAFFSVNGVPRYGIARLNGDGSLDTTFDSATTIYYAVNAIAVQANGQVLIGGPFGVARLNVNGSTDANFLPSVQGAVRALAVQNDGKVIIGGDFLTVNNIGRNRIARLNSDGSSDATFNSGSGANSSVQALRLQPNGKILIAGAFTKINGITRHRLARLEINGDVDLTFDPGFGPNDNVESIAIQADGRIVAGGRFTAVNGVANSYVARLNHDGSPDLTFDSHLGPNDRVLSVALDGDGKVVIGGLFTKVNETARPFVARLLGGNPGAFSPVILQPPGSQTVAAGEDVTFTVLASGVPQPTYHWQFNGTNITGANTWTLSLHNVRVASAGNYSVVISNALGTVASLPAFLTVVPPPRHAGAPDINFYSGLGPNDRVNTLAVQSDDKIIIGGAFTQVDGTNRNRIARLNRNGRLDPAFDPGLGPNNRVNAAALQQDGRVLIGGDFFLINNTNRNGVARLNTDGSLDVSFAPQHPFQPVYAIALQPNGQVLVGGAFIISVEGLARSSIARLNADGSLDATFNASLQSFSPVLALAVQNDGKIIIGGQFTSLSGVTRSYIARLNIDGSLDMTFDPTAGTSSLVYALALQPDEKIILGGAFTYVNFVLRQRVARLHAAGTLDASFNPRSGADDTVHALALQEDGKVLVGGRFNTFGNMSRNGIARLNDNGSLDLSFDPGSGATEGTSFIDEYGEFVDLTVVSSIARQADGKVIIGGDFTQVNGVTRRYVARLFDREALPLIYIRRLASQDGEALELSWDTGALQIADELDGPWNDLVNAESPYVFTPGGSQKFFRLKFN